MSILTVNLLLSTLIFWIAARLYLLPRLSQTRPQAVLLPVLLLHSFRHLGLMFLAPGATYAGIPLLIWTFNVEGSLDLFADITLATVYHASDYMGPAYWIPAFWVPALLVTHYIAFLILVRYWPRERYK